MIEIGKSVPSFTSYTMLNDPDDVVPLLLQTISWNSLAPVMGLILRVKKLIQINIL